MTASLGIIMFAVWKLNQSLLSAFIKPERNESIVDIIYNHRYLRRGPKIVAIGGGTGLSTLLRGLKEYTGNITAIVSIADDGGSSGRLQRELGVLPPGDIRKNIAALADAEPLMSRLFEYRFAEGEGLEGHSFGNLFIVAMTDVAGNFEEAVRETSRVLAVRGQILPATLSALTLCARTDRRRDRPRRVRDHRARAREGDLPRPADDPGEPGRHPRDPAGGPHRLRAGQPADQRAAEPARRGHPAGDRGVAGAEGVRLQRRDAARRDGRVQASATTSRR